MKKTKLSLFTVTVLLLAMLLSLTACGEKAEPVEEAAPPENAEEPAAEAEEEENPEIKPGVMTINGMEVEVIDVGDFYVAVPEGWMALPDMPDGVVNPGSIKLYKGISSEEEASAASPLVIIASKEGMYNNMESIMESVIYESTSELPQERLELLTNFDWTGFRGKSTAYEDERLYAPMPGNEEKCIFTASMMYSRHGNYEFSIEDDDVITILLSLTMK